jgi:hypothetical protein
VRHDWRDTRPAWSLLYVIALFQAGLVALIEVSVPPGALRTTLEGVAVVAGFGLMLTWRRLNRARLDLERNRV